MPLYLILASLLTCHVSLNAAPLHQQNSPERFKTADAAFRERSKPARAREALQLYRDLVATSPTDFEAHWRLSLACHFVGMRLEQDSDTKLSLFEEGREAGRRSISLSPKCAACHFWTAINMALYGQEKGMFKMFFSLKQIKEHLKISVQEDPAYAYSGAYRLLGVIQRKLPGILGGDNDDARDYFEKAILTSPDEPMNYLVYALLLAEEFDDKPAALQMALRGLAVPTPSEDRMESLDALAELRTLKDSLDSAQIAALPDGG